MTLVESSMEGAVGRLTLRRPEKRNAISHAVADQYLAAIDRFLQAGVSIVVLRAEGRVFCAGADLEEATRDPLNPATERILDAMMRQPLFWVAAVQGPALGAGVSLLSVCPLVVLSDTAWLSLPEVEIGLMPTAVMAYLEPLAGPRAALELGLTGRRISASEAVSLNLATETTPADRLEGRVLEWTDQLAGQQSITRTAGEAWRARYASAGFRLRKAELDAMLDVEALTR